MGSSVLEEESVDQEKPGLIFVTCKFIKVNKIILNNALDINSEFISKALFNLSYRVSRMAKSTFDPRRLSNINVVYSRIESFTDLDNT